MESSAGQKKQGRGFGGMRPNSLRADPALKGSETKAHPVHRREAAEGGRIGAGRARGRLPFPPHGGRGPRARRWWGRGRSRLGEDVPTPPSPAPPRASAQRQENGAVLLGCTELEGERGERRASLQMREIQAIHWGLWLEAVQSSLSVLRLLTTHIQPL